MVAVLLNDIREKMFVALEHVVHWKGCNACILCLKYERDTSNMCIFKYAIFMRSVFTEIRFICLCQNTKSGTKT